MDNVNSSRFLTLAVDLIAIMVFMGMITMRIQWRIYPNDYAVKLININPNYEGDIEKDIHKAFDAKFGKIHEVAVIKDTGDVLK